MKFVFFQNPYNLDKVAYTVTQESVSSLVKKGVITKGVKTLVMDYVEPADMDAEFFLLLYNLDCAKFDDKNKPTKLVINPDVAVVNHLEVLRKMRAEAFATLDSLQLRFILANKQDVLDEIEADKQALRDMPSDIKLGKVDSMVKLHNQIPTILLVDYEAKYKGR